MTVGTTLPANCYLSVASPPSRDADAGFTMFGWFYVPTFTASDFHSTMLLNYVTNNVGEGFQFEASSSTVAQGFVMCYPPNFDSIGGSYSSGTWYFQADVFTRSGGVTTRNTYISTTAGATPTLIATKTWTVADASPEWFDLGYARDYNRGLRGTFEYVGVAAFAMSTAELAAQSNSATPTVSCWVFISGENGTYVDSSGNSRTIVLTGGPPTASDVEAPLSINDAAATLDAAVTTSGVLEGIGELGAALDVSIAAQGGLGSQGDLAAFTDVFMTVDAAMSGDGALGVNATIGLDAAGSLLAGTAFGECDLGVDAAATIAGLGALSGNATVGVDSSGAITDELPRIICYGNSVTAGYGISNPALHYPPQLKSLLGDRVESVVELGFSGQSTATLDANFATNVGPYIDPARRNIIVWQEVFNSANAGVPAATILTSYWSVCAKARAAGCEVIAQDTSAADLDSQAHPEIVATCNDAQASQWGAHADGFVKISTTFYDPTDTYLYQADGAHFTAAGLQILASLVYVEVDRLLTGGSFIAELTAPIDVGIDTLGSTSGLGALDADCSLTLDAAGDIIGPGSHGDCDISISAGGTMSALGAMAANATISIGFAGSFVLPTISESAGAKYRAARSASVSAGDSLSIPQWVRSFEAIAPCTVVLYDRSGTPISSAITGASLRPAIAVNCRVTVSGVLTFFY